MFTFAQCAKVIYCFIYICQYILLKIRWDLVKFLCIRRCELFDSKHNMIISKQWFFLLLFSKFWLISQNTQTHSSTRKLLCPVETWLCGGSPFVNVYMCVYTISISMHVHTHTHKLPVYGKLVYCTELVTVHCFLEMALKNEEETKWLK